MRRGRVRRGRVRRGRLRGASRAATQGCGGGRVGAAGAGGPRRTIRRSDARALCCPARALLPVENGGQRRAAAMRGWDIRWFVEGNGADATPLPEKCSCRSLEDCARL